MATCARSSSPRTDAQARAPTHRKVGHHGGSIATIRLTGIGILMQLRGPSAADFMYSDTGGSGPPVVFLHGVLMNGTLWSDIVRAASTLRLHRPRASSRGLP